MLKIVRTDSTHEDFIQLVKYLDAVLAEIDGDEHEFYNQFNKIDAIASVVVAYDGSQPLGCGAFKVYSPGTAEIKRMYVIPEVRGKGIASMILGELEKWAVESQMTRCILETGKRQEDAVHLYLKNGYNVIPNYIPYTSLENSICFEKALNLNKH